MTADRGQHWTTPRAARELGDRPHHVANLVLRRMGVVRPPIDVRQIAEAMGVSVELVADAAWSSALRFDTSRATMWLRRDLQDARARFHVAHQLGHLFMHDARTYTCDSLVGGWRETEATEFAVSLLVPLWLLEPIATSSRRNIQNLAELFGVSDHWVAVQLEKLL